MTDDEQRDIDKKCRERDTQLANIPLNTKMPGDTAAAARWVTEKRDTHFFHGGTKKYFDTSENNS